MTLSTFFPLCKSSAVGWTRSFDCLFAETMSAEAKERWSLWTCYWNSAGQRMRSTVDKRPPMTSSRPVAAIAIVAETGFAQIKWSLSPLLPAVRLSIALSFIDDQRRSRRHSHTMGHHMHKLMNRKRNKVSSRRVTGSGGGEVHVTLFKTHGPLALLWLLFL